MRVLFACLIVLVMCLPAASLTAQQAEWQQRVNYEMDVHLDVNTHNLTGTQRLTYFNNSPDTLHRIYYHLYFNAFQPGSMMDERSRTIVDPDRRVMDRIAHLDENEIGYQRIHALSQDEHPVEYRTEGTILIVELAHPLPPRSSMIMDMQFEAQVPVQIRRSGRNNREGIAYSMAQWYPKPAEYDQDGWHTHPYVAREFHGVWGDFDVRITIDRNYTVGGTGYLQNPQEIGHGYEDPQRPLNVPDTDELTWHFHAPNVIDFMWGADDKFTHEQVYMEDEDITIHLLYVPSERTRNWEILGEVTAEAIRFVNDYIGPYPYRQFSVIQGGDGGMEYPMATLITGHRNLYSLAAVTVHELLHMWYQTTLATNESLHHWMDEGFTVYVSALTMQHLFELSGDPHLPGYMSYLRLVHDQLEEPMGQQADHYDTNAAYSMASYRKGALILHQLEYIVGEETFKRAMQRYYEEWKFRHPDPVDFRRVVEKESGMILGWYFDTMLYSTRTIDLAVQRLRNTDEGTKITLANKSDFLIPVDVLVEYNDGSRELFYIPRHEMLSVKETESWMPPRTNLDAWFWTHREYSFTIPVHKSEIKRVEIDPTNRLADKNRMNNTWPRPYDYRFLQPPQPNWNTYQVGYRPALWYGENSGIRAGLRLNGAYLFNTKQVEASLMLTSGNIENDPDIGRMDVDYSLSVRDRWRFLGPEGWWYAATGRYYGVDYQRVGIEKRLGRYGRLEPLTQHVQFEAYHLRRTADRNIVLFDSMWEQESLAGISATYTFENPDVNGFRIRAESAVSGGYYSAHQMRVQANRTFQTSDRRFSSRFGFEAGGGSINMPMQQRYNLAQGSLIERWENKTYWSTANISESLTDDLNLVFDSGNALSVYALAGSDAFNINGNNMVSFTIWNTYRPFLTGSLRPFSLEAFAGAGRAWYGNFIQEFELPSSDFPYLATAGAGLSFDFSEIPGTGRWTGQSHFLRDLKLSIRTPLYVHNPADGSETDIRWMFGVSQGF